MTDQIDKPKSLIKKIGMFIYFFLSLTLEITGVITVLSIYFLSVLKLHNSKTLIEMMASFLLVLSFMICAFILEEGATYRKLYKLLKG